MPNEFDESSDLHYVGFYNAVVVDNEDPKKLGRVRFRIPGLIEPAGAFAFPLGIGGGASQRGFYDPPDKGADIGVLFMQGDLEQPYYLGGHWGEPDSGVETPGPAASASAADAPKVKAYETSRYLTVWDNRSGQEEWFIRDKETGDTIVLNAADGVRLSTQQKVIIDAAGDVEIGSAGNVSIGGTQVELNGPGVAVGRVGDAVQVTIPPGVVLVLSPTGPVPNPVPIIVPGTIVSGSVTVKAG